MGSTWLPARQQKNQYAVTAVTCPRKGPLPSEISLLVCGHMHDTRPEKCAEQRCQKAIAFMPELEQLRGIARATLRVFQDPPPHVYYSDRQAVPYDDIDVDGEAERV